MAVNQYNKVIKNIDDLKYVIYPFFTLWLCAAFCCSFSLAHKIRLFAKENFLVEQDMDTYILQIEKQILWIEFI